MDIKEKVDLLCFSQDLLDGVYDTAMSFDELATIKKISTLSDMYVYLNNENRNRI